MMYQKFWDNRRVREVLTTESRQKSRDLFLQTHRPFQRIRLDFSKEDGRSNLFITEDDLCTAIQSSPLNAHNRLFLIVGEAGSGKSELCQWLEYEVDPDLRLAIHIPRSMTSAAQVIGLLREKLGEVATNSALRRTPLADQADYIALLTIVLLYEQHTTALTPLDTWADLLRSHAMRHAIAEHLASAREGNRTHRLLASNVAIEAMCAAAGIVIEQAQTPAVGEELRRLLGRAMEQTLWLGDLRALLSELSEQAIAHGRRPLLLLEDVTAFQLLGDRLLDYLLDLSSGHFDAVIGVTTGYEQTRLASVALVEDLTHVHHRLTARCVLTDEQGRAYGFEDGLIEFTRGYLRAVRGVQTTLAPTPFGGDLYPFTETALRRALKCLHEEGNPRQTPRLFLEHVLGAALLADDIPPMTLDRSTYLLTPPLLFRSDDIDDIRLQSTLRWYGDIGEEHVMLDSKIAEVFGTSINDLPIKQNSICVERAYVPQQPGHMHTSSDWQLELRELQQWLSHGGLYPSRETLKRGIERAILSLGDPRSLANAHSQSLSKAEIVYARGDERLPIVLGKNSGDQPSTEAYIKVEVQGSFEERGILEELAYLELSGTNLAQVSQNLAVSLDWVHQHWKAYNSEIHAMLSHRLGGLHPEEIIWSAWRLICALENNMWSVRPTVQQSAEGLGAYAQITPWSPAHQTACYRTGEALLQWRDLIRRLFIGAFMLRDTLLDRTKVMAMAASDQGDATIHRIAQMPLKSLQTVPFKVRPSGQQLYGLLAPLQHYAIALTDLNIGAALEYDLLDLRYREAYLAQQGALDVELLRLQITELRRRCGEVGVTWREPWDEALDYMVSITPDHISELRVQARTLVAHTEQLVTAGSSDIWTYQYLRHALRPLYQHSYWSALITVRNIQDTLLSTARGRYRREGKILIGTQAYRSLLQQARSLWKEVENESAAIDGRGAGAVEQG